MYRSYCNGCFKEKVNLIFSLNNNCSDTDTFYESVSELFIHIYKTAAYKYPENGGFHINIFDHSSNGVKEILSYSAAMGILLSSKALSQLSTPVPHQAFIIILPFVEGILLSAV